MAAMENSRMKLSYFDARGVAGGATGRNGGHLWANPESEFEREVTKDVLKFIEEEGVECDLTNGGAASLVRVAPPSGVKYNDRADTDPEVESGDEWGDGPTWDAATCAASSECMSPITCITGGMSIGEMVKLTSSGLWVKTFLQEENYPKYRIYL